MLRLLAGVIAAFALCPCAVAEDTPPYTGADAGYAVFSLGEVNPHTTYVARYQSYVLHICNADGPGHHTVTHTPPDNRDWLRVLLGPKPDYKSPNLSGVVAVLTLAPGDYAFCAAEFIADGQQVFVYDGIVRRSWYADGFRVPFHVEAGQAVYLGRFRAEAVTVRGALTNLKYTARGHFAVSDQSIDDLPIARVKKPSLPEPKIAIVDVKSANSEVFVEDK
jgi:hypothetical protein